MRRFKQALPSSENIAILKQKTHGILALCDEKSFPYTVPLNYVYLNDKIYFHCANVGRKLDIIHQSFFLHHKSRCCHSGKIHYRLF